MFETRIRKKGFYKLTHKNDTPFKIVNWLRNNKILDCDL